MSKNEKKYLQNILYKNKTKNTKPCPITDSSSSNLFFYVY